MCLFCTYKKITSSWAFGVTRPERAWQAVVNRRRSYSGVCIFECVFEGAKVCLQDEVTRKMMWSMFQACTEPDPEHPLRHFRASAIISNPRAFGSLCCAERLKVLFLPALTEGFQVDVSACIHFLPVASLQEEHPSACRVLAKLGSSSVLRESV